MQNFKYKKIKYQKSKNLKYKKYKFFKKLIVAFLNISAFLLISRMLFFKKSSMKKNACFEDVKQINENLKPEEIEKEPEKETENLDDSFKEKEKKQKNVISSFKTKLSTEREKEKNRVYNIKKAASFLNNLTIKPNSEFSFKKSVWQNKKSESYKYADTLTQNGMDKGLGGGICQVATTLYIAALKANLKITQRQPHSRVVSYAPLGLDASYFSNYKDLRFINSLDEKIKIKTKLKNDELTVKLLTEKPIKKNYDEIIIEKAKILEETKKNIKTDVLVKVIKNEKVKESKHIRSCYRK